MFVTVCSYFLLSCFFIENIYTFDVPYDVESFEGYDIDVGDALFLTPYLEENRINAAREAAKVSPFLGNDESYSGLFTVNEKTEANVHFWFFLAKQNWTNSTTIVSLSTGTGVSCIEGLFTSNGPYGYNGSHLNLRSFSWTENYNLLCLDTPGTGYGFGKSTKAYPKDAKEVAQSISEGLYQFYQLFPELKKKGLIVYAQSLAGQFIPYLAYFLNDQAYKKKYNINLKGLFVGNPTLDLGSQPIYGEYYHSLGLIGKAEKGKLQDEESKIKLFKQSGLFGNATDTFCKIFCPAYTHPDPTLFETLTGLNQNSNALKYSANTLNYTTVLNDPSTREKLHVGNIKWKRDRRVFETLKKALFEKPKIGWEYVFENKIKTLLLFGQWDFIVPPLTAEKAVGRLSWSEAKDYDDSVRTKLFYNDKLVGYYKSAKNVITMVIRNAGHDASADRPGYVRAILKDFIAGVFDDIGDSRAVD